MNSNKLIAVDLETTSLAIKFRKDWGEITAISFYDGEKGFALSPDKGLEFIKKLIENDYTLIFHNSSFDVAVLERFGVEVKKYHDTMIMSYAWVAVSPEREEATDEHSLLSLAPLVGESKMEKPNNWKVATEYLKKYAVQDAKITYKLFLHFRKRLKSDKQAWKHYIEIELPYSKIVRQLEQGSHVNLDSVREFKLRLEMEVHDLYCQITHITGYTFSFETKEFRYHAYVDPDNGSEMTSYREINGKKEYTHCALTPFNPNSDDHKAQVLQKIYKWKPAITTPTGKPKMSKDILGSLPYPLAKLFLLYSSKQTLLSNFLDKIEKQVSEYGILHGSFNQCKTRTGRLSSSSMDDNGRYYGVNLQNIPSKDEGADLRKMFIAPPGYKIICGDLEKIEIVVLAHYLETLVGDSYFSDMVRNGVEVHDINTENWIIKCSKEDYIEQYGEREWIKKRKACKNSVFCLIYGGGEAKLASTSGLPVKEAKALIEEIYSQTKIKEMKELVADIAVAQSGVIHDCLGRRLYVPELLSDDKSVYQAGFRKVNNYLIQGSAGSIFKELQLRLYFEAQDNGWQDMYRQTLAVHDESVYEVKDNLVDEFVSLANRIFYCEDLISLPVKATFHVADNWYDAKEGG